MSANDPAFPCPPVEATHNPPAWYPPGLTKRELFAAMAMQGLLASGGIKALTFIESVECADALIAELEKANGK